FAITRGILEVLAEHPGLHVSITTKSPLVTRDVDVLARIARHSAISVHVSLITVNRSLARRLEPRAPTPDARLRAIARLHDAGVAVSVNCMPVLPGITDHPRDLEALVRCVADAGASHISTGALRLQHEARKRYLPFIAQEFPELAPRYARAYAHAYLPGDLYRERLAALMARLCRAHGLRRKTYEGDGAFHGHRRARRRAGQARRAPRPAHRAPRPVRQREDDAPPRAGPRHRAPRVRRGLRGRRACSRPARLGIARRGRWVLGGAAARSGARGVVRLRPAARRGVRARGARRRAAALAAGGHAAPPVGARHEYRAGGDRRGRCRAGLAARAHATTTTTRDCHHDRERRTSNNRGGRVCRQCGASRVSASRGSRSPRRGAPAQRAPNA